MDFSPPPWASMTLTYQALGVEDGGKWKPQGCVPRQRVAVIVPYRDRLSHLHVFINHIHKVMTRQNMHYQIFVVEQVCLLLFSFEFIHSDSVLWPCA
jgi:hypothetical protein